jgi:Fic family protein
MTIPYVLPDHWVKYDQAAVLPCLTTAKAVILSLTTIPFQRSWAEKLQKIQLKREIAGTSRIEGADFTDKELDAAMAEDLDRLSTRSQRQAAAAVRAYRWIANLPNDYPIDRETILEIHRLIVRDADEDHCPPGILRGTDQNVTFGSPRHRGVEGGSECESAFDGYCSALVRQMADHDPLVCALAAHYHFAAMHPFLDGNGRTARTLEALFLQRCGLRDTLFIAMSNYYYEEKNAYLRALAEVRAKNHDLTSFLVFGLRGIELQCARLLEEIRVNLSKALFRDQMYNLFNRLMSTRKRVIAERQIKMLALLLEREMTGDEFYEAILPFYSALKNPEKARSRDVSSLLALGALGCRKIPPGTSGYEFFARLEWPTEITETEFFRIINEMPKAKTHSFLDR